MKRFSIFLISFVFTVSYVLAEESDSKHTSKDSGLTCYLPYSIQKDHMVAGCEVSGYHMRYDIAQQWKVFMVLLPIGADSIKNSPTYFSIDTFTLDGGSLQKLFDADVKGIQDGKPGTKVVKKLTHKLPLGDSGSCIGAELEYPKTMSAFPNEIFFMCETGSKNYAIMLSLGARTKKAMVKESPIFLKWMDVPQIVKDANIHVF